MTDPPNFRPAWWHNRDYGLMVANPFGQEAMKQGAKSRVRVQRGESFRLRFGAVIHQGQPENVAAVQGVPRDWVSDDGLLPNEKFIAFAQPLIEGESFPTFEHGLPKLAPLERVPVERKLPPHV
jgi:hypothetical protein